MNQANEIMNSKLSLGEMLQDSIDVNEMNNSNNPFSIKDETFQFFHKQIKLRNAIKKDLWPRTKLQSKPFQLKATEQIPTILISSKVEQSIVNYLINNPNSDFIGRLFQSTPCLYDKIESSEDNRNLFLSSESLEADRFNDSIHKLLKQTSMKITKAKMPLQSLFVYKRKGETVVRKIWTIFPNVSFELNQISNLSLSNTPLNKYLISKSMKSTDEEGRDYLSGLLTLSKENRLVALTEKTYKKNHVIIGIWINLKEEQPKHDCMELNKLLMKNQYVIYQKCFEFVEKYAEIEAVFSPNRDEGVFLLVVFYHGMQCQYEIKLNEKDKKLCNEEGQWLIAKINSLIDLRFSSSAHCFDYSKSPGVKIQSVTEFMEKKFNISSQVSVLTKSQAINEDNNSTLMLPVTAQENERDKADEQLQELLSNTYLDIDSFDDLYDYPLIMPQHFKLNRKSNPIDKGVPHEVNVPIQSKPSGEILHQNKKQTEELLYSQASTNGHSNLLLSLKHSHNTQESNTINNINTLIHQTTQQVKEQCTTLKQLNKQVSQAEAKAHQLLNRILMSTKHTTTNQQLKPSNTSIQVPHIHSVNLTSLNEEE